MAIRLDAHSLVALKITRINAERYCETAHHFYHSGPFIIVKVPVIRIIPEGLSLSNCEIPVIGRP
jgi:hypothetical protein